MELSKNLSTLYLVPTFLGEQQSNVLFPDFNITVIQTVKHWIVENARTARRAIKSIAPQVDIAQLHIYEIPKHSTTIHPKEQLQPLIDGCNMAIMSEAGMPCIADPGHLYVAAAHELGLRVQPLIGPSSILLALVASGFNGQNFSFHGYVPLKQGRTQAIKQWERDAITTGTTHICMETPYRNDALLQDFIKNLQAHTKLCIASNISLPQQFIRTATVLEWKKNIPLLHKKPTIFLIGQ